MKLLTMQFFFYQSSITSSNLGLKIIFSTLLLDIHSMSSLNA